MKRNILSLILGLAGILQVNAQCDQQWWAKQFGGDNEEELEAFVQLPLIIRELEGFVPVIG